MRCQRGNILGYQGHYRYRVLTQDSGSMVIFLDCSTERSSDRFFCCSPAPLAQLPSAVSCIAALFSRRAIRPIEEGDGKAAAILEDASHELKTPWPSYLPTTMCWSSRWEPVNGQTAFATRYPAWTGCCNLCWLTKLDAQRPELHMELLDFQLPDFSGGRVI